jgi:hypothetical protein
MYRMALQPCKYPGCTGDPVVRESRNPDAGWFVGCTGWRYNHDTTIGHRYIRPASIESRHYMQKLIKNEVIEDARGFLEICYNAQSPRNRTEHCCKVLFMH